MNLVLDRKGHLQSMEWIFLVDWNNYACVIISFSIYNELASFEEVMDFL
jgi:hypothetical protein